MEDVDEPARVAVAAGAALRVPPPAALSAPPPATLSASVLAPRLPSAPSLLAYVLPAIGTGLVTNLLHIYFLKFATDVLLIAPAILGVLFGLSRMWDAVSDPLVGYWSDRCVSPWGRRRPWVLGAALPLAVATFAVWSPPAALEGATLAVWCGVSIVLFYTALTALVVPHTAWGAELTTDYHGRTRVFGAREIADKLGLFLALAAIAWLESATQERSAAAWMIAAPAVLLIVASGVSVRFAPDDASPRRRGPANALGAVRDVLRNRHARVFLAVLFLDQLGFATVATLLPYASDYVLGTPGATAGYLLAFVAPTVLSVPIWLGLSRRLGKRRVWFAALLVKVIAFAALFEVSDGMAGAVYGLIASIGFAHGCSSVIPQSIQADIVDVDESITGERKEGVYFAAWGLVTKTAAGVSIVLVGTSLDAVGFQPGAEQTLLVVFLIRVMIAAFPCAALALAALLLRRFSLDGDSSGIYEVFRPQSAKGEAGTALF